MSRQHLLYGLTLCLFSGLSFSDNAPQYLYDLLLPKLVKFDIEDPSQAEVHFINICHAHNHGGTHFELPNKELWQAVNSIAMFDIVTQYMPTITASGRIALARQYAQMSDNITTIQHKVELQRYLKQNPGLLRKLEKVVAQAQSAEETFAALFKTISEEEQAEIDRINAQLYFSWFTTFNENEWALGTGPRLNQMHTTAWYTIPPVIVSTLHRVATHKLAYDHIELEQKVVNKTQESGNAKLYLEKLEKEIQQYKDQEKVEKTTSYGTKYYPNHSYEIAQAQEQLDIATKYTSTKQEDFSTIITGLEKKRLDHIADASHIKLLNLLKKEVKQKDPQELSWQEKKILDANPEGKEPKYNAHFPPRSIKDLVPGARIFAQDGIKNLPYFAFDATKQTVKGIYKEATEHNVYNHFKRINPDNSTLKNVAWTGAAYAYIAGLASAYPGILLWRYYSTKNLFDLIYEKQQTLFSVAHLVKSMHCTYSIIDQDPTLRKLLQSEHQQLGALFSPKGKATSSGLKHLIQQLLSPSFQGQASYFLSQPGKILATHQLLSRIKHELVPYLETFGNIDAYLTIQKLYLEYENHSRVQFCLPELVDATTPVLDISEYWHPLIDPSFVVTNSLTMGTNGINNLMITGPNAGGKTTSLMSLIINIIFAQSFGIAPSKTLTMTPFAKIHSYLDITTNLQEGLSLFAAEVDRAKKLKQSILSCTPGQKTFTIIDEIFSGTNPQVASDVGFKFAAQLGEMAHSMTIITTHFPRLTDLEKEVKTFTNYKVADATIMPDGKVVYPFKLIPGISSQNIAQHMLEQQGII